VPRQPFIHTGVGTTCPRPVLCWEMFPVTSLCSLTCSRKMEMNEIGWMDGWLVDAIKLAADASCCWKQDVRIGGGKVQPSLATHVLFFQINPTLFDLPAVFNEAAHEKWELNLSRAVTCSSGWLIMQWNKNGSWQSKGEGEEKWIHRPALQWKYCCRFY